MRVRRPLRPWLRLLRLGLHLVAGALTILLLFPHLNTEERQRRVIIWSRKLTAILNVRVIVHDMYNKEEIIKPLNRRFQIRNDYIEPTSEDVFQRAPLVSGACVAIEFVLTRPPWRACVYACACLSV